MDHLYPKETVQKAAQNAILSDNFSEIVPILSTLLRQQKKRDDLLPCLASLITSSNILTKFLSYLIILRNIRGDASMIVLNQVLKDLSNQNWVIQNIALFTLVTISQVSEEIVDYDTVERSILATIKHGNLRAGSSALVNLQSGKWINKVAQLIIQLEDSQAAINFIRFARRREPALQPRATEIFLNILAADLEKPKVNSIKMILAPRFYHFRLQDQPTNGEKYLL